MKTRRRFLETCGAIFAPWALVTTSRRISGQEGAAAREAAPFLDDAKKYAITTKGGARLKLNDKSLLNWTNPARQQERGAIYVWLDRGRPLAIGSFFTYEFQGKAYRKHEFHSLADGPLEATFGETLAWTPAEPGIQWQVISDAPRPGTTHVNRLLQMRQLARRYRAELTNPEGDTNELRLAPRPLLEYESPEAGVIDGAILTFVVATDPELLLLIEAFEESGKVPRYRAAFARFHFWELRVYEGDRQTWSADLDRGHEANALGNPEMMSKVYNSYHSRGAGVAEP
jgi:hypothetical protein